MKHVIIFFLLSTFAVDSNAASKAVKTPPMKICVQVNGTLIAKKSCGKGETIASLALISSQGPQGPAGPQGPQGPQGNSGISGTMNPNKCISRFTINSGTGVVINRLDCVPGEFLLTHGVLTSNGDSEVIEMALLFPPGTGVATGVQYTNGFNSNPNLFFSTQVDAVCCVP